MNDWQILTLKRQGYCCSQIMVIMTLDLMGENNKDLVSFSKGLCMGGGLENGPCGILTAGMGILAMLAGQGPDGLGLMQEEFLAFFQTLCPDGIGCRDISGDYYPSPDPQACGELLSQSYSGLMGILAENGFDPADRANHEN